MRKTDKNPLGSSLCCCQNLFHVITLMLLFGVCVFDRSRTATVAYFTIGVSSGAVNVWIWISYVIVAATTSFPVVFESIIYNMTVSFRRIRNATHLSFFFLFIALNGSSIFKMMIFCFGKSWFSNESVVPLGRAVSSSFTSSRFECLCSYPLLILHNICVLIQD